ncbi:hypothetical protein WA026_008613 [Henosepilachna vigintioctopunctata]|uniref:Nucleolus and neural progenitor protein-like N-terminal domain-containing protein n=1 Tax=Henosepilachna vigintioctopunctata TaxID=420089 RepID=A0AAW1UHW4_9CUCU
MELWNNRILKAPPTYTCQATKDEVDINHLEAILQEGAKFYKEQYLLNLESALLARIIYRMKRKFRNSKDFRTLEKVKKDLMKFVQIDISKKLEFLLSLMPKNIFEVEVFLPTKNMLDFILIRLQGVGKILCQVVQMCKLTAWYYERRLHLGHFWRLALVAIGLMSRIHILSLNIIKFTCLLYTRLLPFSHKLKNSGREWLPKEYIFPKDLKAWLNIEWSKMEEVIEIADKDFNLALIDLVEDSDDDIQFCKEYIELDHDEDLEIITEFKRINKKIKPIEYEDSLAVLRGFSSKFIDTGEVMSLSDEKDEEEIEIHSNKNSSYTPNTQQSAETYVDDEYISVVEEVDIGELIASSDEDGVADTINSTETIIDSCKDVQDQVHNKAMPESKKDAMNDIEDKVLISSSDDELVDISSNDSVKFVEEVASPSLRQNMITSDFISFNKNDDSLIHDNKIIEEKQSGSILEITDTSKIYLDTRSNNSHLDDKDIIEISGNTSVDCTNSIVSYGKRKGTWDKGKKIRKKPKWSRATTLDVADVNVSKSGDESIDVTEHSFGTLICSTSTPAKKPKTKQMRMQEASLLSESNNDFEIANTSLRKKKVKKISNVKQTNRKRKKRLNKNNVSNIVKSNSENKINPVLNTSSNNISCSSADSINKSRRLKKKKKALKC